MLQFPQFSWFPILFLAKGGKVKYYSNFGQNAGVYTEFFWGILSAELTRLLSAVLPTGHFYCLFRKTWHFVRHRAFSFVNKNAIKHGKNAPFLCIGHFFRNPYVVKTSFGHFFTNDGAFFRSEGLATLALCTGLPGGAEGTIPDKNKCGRTKFSGVGRSVVHTKAVQFLFFVPSAKKRNCTAFVCTTDRPTHENLVLPHLFLSGIVPSAPPPPPPGPCSEQSR